MLLQNQNLQISFARSLEENVTLSFILEEAKETIFDFPQETVKVL